VLRPWWSDAAKRAPNCRRAGAPAACAPDEGATECDSWRSESDKSDKSATRRDAVRGAGGSRGGYGVGVCLTSKIKTSSNQAVDTGA
jgi:hypothetical protein